MAVVAIDQAKLRAKLQLFVRQRGQRQREALGEIPRGAVFRRESYVGKQARAAVRGGPGEDKAANDGICARDFRETAGGARGNAVAAGTQPSARAHPVPASESDDPGKDAESDGCERHGSPAQSGRATTRLGLG